jgi:hypothetical protein
LKLSALERKKVSWISIAAADTGMSSEAEVVIRNFIFHSGIVKRRDFRSVKMPAPITDFATDGVTKAVGGDFAIHISPGLTELTNAWWWDVAHFRAMQKEASCQMNWKQ